MADLAALLIGSLLVNNFVLAQFLGLCPFMGATQSLRTASAMGLATTFVLTTAAALAHGLYFQVLVPLELEYLKIIVFMVVVATTVGLTERYVAATSPVLHEALGIYLPLITTNCAVLGVALLATAEPRPFLHTLVFAAGAAGGFVLVLIVFAALRERLAAAAVPRAMQGTPITLVTAGIMALAFMGFKGLGA